MKTSEIADEIQTGGTALDMGTRRHHARTARGMLRMTPIGGCLSLGCHSDDELSMALPWVTVHMQSSEARNLIGTLQPACRAPATEQILRSGFASLRMTPEKHGLSS